MLTFSFPEPWRQGPDEVLRYEVEARVLYRNDHGPIIRIDKTRGNDSTLVGWTHDGSKLASASARN